MKLDKADPIVDDLEPLFDYHRVQPLNIVCIDDDCSDASPVPSPKRRKLPKTNVVQVDLDKDVEVVNVEEEDWLAPPPMVSTNAYSKLGEDSTIKELRRTKQELLSLAQSAKSMLLEVEEPTKEELNDSLKPSLGAAEQPKTSAPERAKIVISIQNKDELKQFRVYMDDKFEKLFNLYADKAKLDPQNLVFSFDGDKIHLAATPASLGMEDDDIIEVHVKKS